MNVYIEAVLIDNFFITWLIAVLTFKALSIKVNWLRIAIASTLGMVVALIFPFIDIHIAITLTIRIALFIGLSFILFFKSRRFILASLVFLAFTFTFGGAIFAIGLAVHGSLYYALTRPVTNIPVGAIIFAGFLIYFVMKKLVRKLKRVYLAKGLTTTVKIEILDKELEFNAFLDTGNVLYDKKTDLPVVVLSAIASLKVLGDKGFSAYLRGKINEIDKKAHYMDFSGVDGKKNKLLILEPDNFLVYFGQATHKIEGVVLGLTLGSSKGFVNNNDVLLHPAIYSSELNRLEIKPQSSLGESQ